MSVRRIVLDPLLVRAAERAGAAVRMATKVTGLVKDGNRVVGARVDGGAGEEELRARLVVGADGRNSTVARLAGARKYNVVPNEHALYWGFFEGAQIGEPTFVFHRWGDRMVQACPTDAGLYQVGVFVELARLDRFRSDLEAQFNGINPVIGLFQQVTITGWITTATVNGSTMNLTGTAKVDMGDGSLPLSGLPLTGSISASGVTLTVGSWSLGTRPMSDGFIIIE